jgi:putative peptide zinc metalloprotease protein
VTPPERHPALGRHSEPPHDGHRRAGVAPRPDSAQRRRGGGTTVLERPAAEFPRRPAGLELLGRLEGSGLRTSPYLVRRSDGQVTQLSPLLYLLVEAADGRRDPAAIADLMSRRLDRHVTADNVSFLVERKLRPAGLLVAADGSEPELAREAPLLALRHRRQLVPAPVVNRLATVFKPLFWPPVVLAALVALIAVDAWLFFSHGVGGPLRSAFYNPVLLLAVFGSIIVATAFHEIGHAAACRYGGARPGAMGAAIYLIWPAFYCDVTDAYRLPRTGRLRTDLGGVFFNVVFALLGAGAYFATGQEALLLIVVIQHVIVIQQLLPLLRFDGYYVLSDLTGVPDILSRVGPILRSLRPFREPDERVKELKPWVRFAVTAYLAALIPLVALLLTWLIVGAPRLFATIFDSLVLHAGRVGGAVGGGEWATAALNALQVGALLLPCAMITVAFGRLGWLLAGGVATWASRSTRRKVLTGAGAGLLAVILILAWGPNGDYRPIEPGERGTVGEGISTLIAGPGDSAVQTQGRQLRVGAVPTGGAAIGSTAARRGTTRPSSARGDDRSGQPSPGNPVPGGGGGSVERGPAPGVEVPPVPTPEAPGGDEQPAGPGSKPAEEQGWVVIPTGRPPHNRAEAVNTTDGSLLFLLAFDLQGVLEGPVNNMNIARAWASCDGCRTIVIAVQIVFVMADINDVVPLNFAEALNYECTGCETLAYARQFILSTGGEVRLTAEAKRRIDEIERALDALRHSTASLLEIRAEIDRLMADLEEVLVGGLVGGAGVAEPEARSQAVEGEASPAGGDPPPPEPDVEPAPVPDREPPEEPSPTAGAETEPAPAATPAPTATPEADHGTTDAAGDEEDAEPAPTPEP